MPILGSGRGSKRITHPSVLALLAAHPEESDPKKLMRRLAREKVAYAKSVGWSGPPFSPRILASIFGIRCKEVDHEIGSEGRLIRYPDGKPWIEYQSGRLPSRQHFTILHEFAHTFFPDFCEYLPLSEAATEQASAPERQFENLCDVAAAEMLIPAEDFQADLDRLPRLNCEAIVNLALLYEASIDAAMHRTMDLTSNVGCAVVFLTDQKEMNAGQGPLWVRYCCRNSMFKGFIPSGTQLPRTSVAVACLQSGQETTPVMKETWWIGGKPRTWSVQATKLPRIPENPAYPKVVALLTPSSYH